MCSPFGYVCPRTLVHISYHEYKSTCKMCFELINPSVCNKDSYTLLHLLGDTCYANYATTRSSPNIERHLSLPDFINSLEKLILKITCSQKLQWLNGISNLHKSCWPRTVCQHQATKILKVNESTGHRQFTNAIRNNALIYCKLLPNTNKLFDFDI